MHPYTRVSGREVSIIDLHTGVVVPELDIRDRHFDDRDESITLAKPAFVELFHIFKGDIQAAEETTI
jgi:hypothetical protein